jgi:protein SCO1/2
MFEWIVRAATGACLFFLFSARVLAQPATATGTNVQIYQAKGIVKELRPNGKTVVIQHEAIPGYMQAMTMPFEVRDTNELRGLQTGDAIAFRITVTETDGWVSDIRKLTPHKPAELPSRTGFFVTRDVEPLNIGDALPEYHFTNEFGKVVSTGQFKGGPLVFTFFFTSCPYPLFCPKLSSLFEETEKKLLAMTNAPAKWQLISISFDPTNDSPEVLRNYAARYHYDPKHWTFVTGDMIDLIAISDEVGEEFSRSPEAGVTHNLRTVVLDAQGRIQKIYHNNEWTADDLVAEILNAAKAKP